MLDAVERKCSKLDKISGFVFLFLCVGMMIVCSYWPDERPNAIKKELTKQGVDVENVDFVYIMNGEKQKEWIYQSSVPIYYKGASVDRWLLCSYKICAPIVRYHVEPYQPDSTPL